MKKVIFSTTLLVVLFFVPISASAGVIINEIMYDLEEGLDTGREWVEILNNSDTPVDLTGWKFYENEINHKLTLIQGEINLPSNNYAIISDKPDKFLIDNPSYSGILFDSAFSLSNSGENLVLKDNNLIIIDEVIYDSSWGANGDGRSLQRKDPDGSSNEPTNWGTGNPTPGTNNVIEEPKEESIPSEEVPTEAPQTGTTTSETTTTITSYTPIADAGNDIIGFIGQEINFDGTESSDPNGYELAYSWNMGNGELIEKDVFTYKYLYQGTYLVTLMVYNGRNYAWDTITVKIQNQEITINEFIPDPIGSDDAEWIEIYNDSNSIVDISNWQLDDGDDGSKPFVFPENTLIAPKNYLVFPKTITNIALNNTSDSVRLLLPEGIVFQEVFYDETKQGMSSARVDEGFVWAVPTPGMANIISAPSIGGQSENISYQYEPEKQTVKEYTNEYTIEYSPPQEEIKGGYTFLAEPKQKTKQEEPSQLATVKQVSSEQTKQNPVNLVLLIIAVILGALVIGLSLTKLRKKFP